MSIIPFELFCFYEAKTWFFFIISVYLSIRSTAYWIFVYLLVWTLTIHLHSMVYLVQLRDNNKL